MPFHAAQDGAGKTVGTLEVWPGFLTQRKERIYAMKPSERVSQLPLPEDRSAEWAWNRFKTTVLTLAEQGGSRRILEIGGGRRPLFSMEEVQRHGFDYTINDVDA